MIVWENDGALTNKKIKKLLNNSRDLNALDLIAACDADLNIFYANNPRVDDHTLFILQRCKS